jgi:hypothetical protein
MSNDNPDQPQPGDKPIGTWADHIRDQVKSKTGTK